MYSWYEINQSTLKFYDYKNSLWQYAKSNKQANKSCILILLFTRKKNWNDTLHLLCGIDVNVGRRWNTYRVLEAKLVSSCFNWPSKASPHLSLLFASRGVKENTLLKVNPGPTGQPSLYSRKSSSKKEKWCHDTEKNIITSLILRCS